MKKMKRIGFLFTIVALVCALGLSLAFFTDRVTADASVSVSDDAIDIDVVRPDPDPDDPTDPEDTDVDPDGTDPDYPTDPTDPTSPWEDPTEDDDTDDLQNWWVAVNAEALSNFNPGDKLALDGKIVNNGSMDVEYRQTFIITSNVAMNTTTPEFRLFTGCTRESYGALTGGTVATVEDISADGKKIIYVTTIADLAAGASVNSNYDLVFDKVAGNSFQGAEVTVDYILEACQDGADWATVATATITAGGADYKVVPQAIAKVDNLFDGEIELGWINTTAGEAVDDTRCVRSANFIPVLGGSEITISNDKGYYVYVFEYDESHSFITYSRNMNASPYTVTLQDNTSYIKIRSDQGTTQNDVTVNYVITY